MTCLYSSGVPGRVFRTKLEFDVRLAGVEDIPQAAINAHKQKEIDRHPPHWLYPLRQTLGRCLAIIVLVSFITCIVAAFVKHHQIAEISFFCIIGGYGLARFLSNIRLRGYAQWRGVGVTPDVLATIPPFARERMRKVEKESGKPLQAVVETLWQEKKPLDPILYLVDRSQKIAIAVWDENGNEVAA